MQEGQQGQSAEEKPPVHIALDIPPAAPRVPAQPPTAPPRVVSPSITPPPFVPPKPPAPPVETIRPLPAHKKHPVRRFFAVLGVLLLSYGIVAGVCGALAIRNVRTAQSALLSAIERAKVFDVTGALEDAEIGAKQFGKANRKLLVLAPFRVVPRIGPALSSATTVTGEASYAANELVEVGESLEEALGGDVGQLLMSPTSLLPDFSTAFKNLSAEDKHRILKTLAENAPKMREAADALDHVRSALPGLAIPDLTWPLKVSFAEFRDKIPELSTELETASTRIRAVVPIMELVPRVLGYPEPRKYLMFFANNTELRPTGGFLGVVATAEVADAELHNLQARDVYDYDLHLTKVPRPPSPAPFANYINVKDWFLRDANWSPDYVESAKVMEQFYLEAQRIANEDTRTPDAIIQFTPKPISELMRLTGPITVQGKTFNADNLVDELEFQVEFGFVDEGIPYDDRKQIIVDLANAFMERLKGFSIAQLLAALTIIETNFEEGHIMVVSHDEPLQWMLDGRGWSGRVLPVEGDYVSVIDANLGALKSDPKVHRTINYTIKPEQDGSYTGRVAITYDHRGNFDLFTSRYRTYTRLYVPLGTQLIETKGSLLQDKIGNPRGLPGTTDVVQELGRLSFGTFTSIEPQEKRTLEFVFKLAPSVVAMIRNGNYALDFEKEKGTVAHGLTLDLDFGSLLRTATPPEDPKNFGNSRYTLTTDLRVNRHFSVELKK